MSPAGKKFKPPKPVGEPFRADPSDPAPFISEGQPLVPAGADPISTPWMNESAFPSVPQGGPPSYSQPRDPLPQFPAPAPRAPVDPETARAQRLGRIGIAAGIASILLSPLFGPVGIALGLMAIKRGERRLGTWALSTGVAGTLIGIIVIVLVATGVFNPDEILNSLKAKQ